VRLRRNLEEKLQSLAVTAFANEKQMLAIEIKNSLAEEVVHSLASKS